MPRSAAAASRRAGCCRPRSASRTRRAASFGRRVLAARTSEGMGPAWASTRTLAWPQPARAERGPSKPAASPALVGVEVGGAAVGAAREHGVDDGLVRADELVLAKGALEIEAQGAQVGAESRGSRRRSGDRPTRRGRRRARAPRGRGSRVGRRARSSTRRRRRAPGSPGGRRVPRTRPGRRGSGGARRRRCPPPPSRRGGAGNTRGRALQISKPVATPRAWQKPSSCSRVAPLVSVTPRRSLFVASPAPGRKRPRRVAHAAHGVRDRAVGQAVKARARSASNDAGALSTGFGEDECGSGGIEPTPRGPPLRYHTARKQALTPPISGRRRGPPAHRRPHPESSR